MTRGDITSAASGIAATVLPMAAAIALAVAVGIGIAELAVRLV